MKVSVTEFERQVYELEGVRIVLRLPQRKQVPEYPFERAASGDTRVRDWKNHRIAKTLGDDIAFTIIDPARFAPDLRITMDQLRARHKA